MAHIDAHQHFWNLTEVEYRWLTPEHGVLYKNHEPEDLAPQLRAAGIDKTVLVQSANSYEDTAYMLKISDDNHWVAAVVGWVDLISPDDTARRVEMYKKHPKFRGVRDMIHNEPNNDWIVQPVVLESLKVLADNNLSFDVSAVFPNHLKHVPTLAEKIPELKIVIDDLGTPPIKAGQMSPWSDQLRLAAEAPNVYAKLSGLNVASDWETWSYSTIKPYIDFAIETFSADRLMFGSGWPVCNLAGSYQSVWIATQRALEGCSKGQIDAILGGTAARVYRI